VGVVENVFAVAAEYYGPFRKEGRKFSMNATKKNQEQRITGI
jgi:hypothetical protein